MQNRKATTASKTRKQPRRTQAERRRQTNLAIMEASLSVLIEAGYAGFSASKVAALAGVSRGAQEHYYPKRNDLIAAATQFAMQQAIAHAKKMAHEMDTAGSPIDHFLDSSENFFFMPSFMAMTQILIAARTDKELANVVYPIIQNARRILDEIWTDSLMQAGYPRKRVNEFIELTHFLLRGVFYVSTWLPYDVRRDAVLSKWRLLAPTILGASQDVTGGNDSALSET